MKFSAKSCYALQIMADLALVEDEGFVSLKNISERRDIGTIKYLEHVVTLLQKAGLVKSLRGNNGGYKLSKSAKDYTVGEILRVTEGSLAPIYCLDTPVNECMRSSKWITLSFWAGFQKMINDYVDGITLQDLIKNKDLASVFLMVKI